MILYTNGGSHAAGVEAVNRFTFATEDLKYTDLGLVPHPDNLKASWGPAVALVLNMMFQTEANTSNNNEDIIRTTKEWIESKAGIVEPSDVFIIIQWVDWHDVDLVREHERIIAFHLYLKKLGFKHVFCNSTKSFFHVLGADHYDFGECYVEPYLPEGSYTGWLELNGYQPVVTSNTFFGAEAHAAWAKQLLQHINKHNMVPNEISIS